MIAEYLIIEYNNTKSEEVREFIQQLFHEEYQLDITHWEKQE